MTDQNNRPDTNRLAFATRTIHGGQQPDPLTGAVIVPIYATSTYAQSSPGVLGLGNAHGSCLMTNKL